MTRLGWLTRDRTAAGRRAPSVIDWAVAIGLLIVALAEVASGAFPGPVGLAAIAQLPAILPVAFRRITPVAALAVCVLTTLPYAVVFGMGNSLANMLAVVLLVYAVGRHSGARGAIIGVALELLLLVELGIGGRLFSVDDYVYVALILFGALGLGVALRVQTERAISFAIAADRAQREQTATAQAAVDDERARIARELHDVVAHNVGLIVLQAGGARSVLDADPERARAALHAVEETGRQTLAEMRLLVGILRVDEAAGFEPLPRLERLPVMIDELRAAGLSVDFDIVGIAGSLPAGLELAAYRLVQESLTNVRKHAPDAHAVVRLAYEHDGLHVEVSDDGGVIRSRDDGAAVAATAGAGHGLIGMRERVQVYDGRFFAGPIPGGGFRVEAVLPLAGAPA